MVKNGTKSLERTATVRSMGRKILPIDVEVCVDGWVHVNDARCRGPDPVAVCLKPLVACSAMTALVKVTGWCGNSGDSRRPDNDEFLIFDAIWPFSLGDGSDRKRHEAGYSTIIRNTCQRWIKARGGNEGMGMNMKQNVSRNKNGYQSGQEIIKKYVAEYDEEGMTEQRLQMVESERYLAGDYRRPHSRKCSWSKISWIALKTNLIWLVSVAHV